MAKPAPKQAAKKSPKAAASSNQAPAVALGAAEPTAAVRCCPYHKDSELKPGAPDPFFVRLECPEPGCGYAVKDPKPRMRERISRHDDADFGARP